MTLYLYILTLFFFYFFINFYTLSRDENYCNFLSFILTLIVFIVNTPESIWDMLCIYQFDLICCSDCCHHHSQGHRGWHRVPVAVDARQPTVQSEGTRRGADGTLERDPAARGDRPPRRTTESVRWGGGLRPKQLLQCETRHGYEGI